MHDSNSHNLDMVRALICGGLYPSVAQHIHKRECRTKAQRVCFIHPTSVNYERRAFGNERFQFFVFGERVETSKVCVPSPLHRPDLCSPAPCPAFWVGGCGWA